MNDKIVTHEDRDTIELLSLTAKAVDLTVEERGRVDEFLARARKAAEADQPPLPEPEQIGTVVRATCVHGKTGIFVKQGEDSWVALPGRWNRSIREQSDQWCDLRDITPLRPTVTEADVEKAAYAIFRERGLDTRYEGCTRSAHIDEARAAFEAAGIEVTS